jgi:hypothetical protein
MNNNITVAALGFNLKASDLKDGSLRREISRGLNLPTELTIKSQSYVDSKTKRPGTRTVVRFDYYMAMTDGKIEPVSYYSVMAVPQDPLVTSAITDLLVSMMVNLLHGTTNTDGLDLKTEIYAGGEQ